MRPVPLRYGLGAVARRLLPMLLGVALLALPACVSATGAAAASTSTESANPINDQGSSYDYRSYITAVTPSVPGLSFQVLEFADRILMTNHTGKTVTIYGYEGEPYARVLANGTAEQNVRSPATYLNTNFYAQVTVPPIADASAPPKWEVIDRTGQFEWHDHRIHWMSPVPPAKVKDKSKRTLDLRLEGPDRGRDRQGRDRRAAVLDAGELQGAAGGDHPGRRDRRGRAGVRAVRAPPARARGPGRGRGRGDGRSGRPARGGVVRAC